MPETSDKKKDDRYYDAQHNACSQRKINGRILAAIKNIARQASDGQASLAKQHHDAADHHQRDSQKNEQPPDSRHDVSLIQTAAFIARL